MSLQYRGARKGMIPVYGAMYKTERIKNVFICNGRYYIGKNVFGKINLYPRTFLNRIQVRIRTIAAKLRYEAKKARGEC